MAPSQSCDSVSLPPDGTVQQQPKSVVVEIAKAVPDALDLLDQQVDGLGGAVGAAAGGMPGQDLGLPRPDRSGQPRELRHANPVYPMVEAFQGDQGGRHADRRVDGSEQLLALPGRGDLTGRIPSGQAGP